jgi:hypothetical protein
MRRLTNGQGMRLTNVGAALNRLFKRVPDPVRGSSLDNLVWTKQRGQGGRPTACTHHHGYRQRTPQAAQGHCRARNDMVATQRRHRR